MKIDDKILFVTKKRLYAKNLFLIDVVTREPF